jgi:hypothetical protein
LESATVACDSSPGDHHAPTQALKRAASEAKLARKTIEELPDLSFTTQSRFFRLFEWLEECMDYAGESMGYEEYEAANTDLCRSRRGIRDAVTLLTTHAGIRAPRVLFRRSAGRLRWTVAATESPSTPEAEVHKVNLQPSREQAGQTRQARIIHLLPAQENPCNQPTRPHLILM